MNLLKTRNVVFLLLMVLSVSIKAKEGESREIIMVDFEAFEPWLYKDSDSVYVINFWATWCAPCIREIPYFEKINERYGAEKVKVLLVSLDFPNQLDSRVLPFLERNNVKSRVILLDDPYSNTWIPKVNEKWTGAIPATVVYSSRERLFFQRELNYEELEEIILPLIDKK